MTDELNVTDAEGGWRTVTAGDVSTMMTELAALRRELEAQTARAELNAAVAQSCNAYLAEARRLLDDARALVRDSCPFVPQWATVLQQRYASFLADAAALRARPQAVPEAVAKDAAPSCFTCIHGAKDDEDYPCRSCRMMSHWSSAALLSAADTEVKNGRP